MRLSQRSDPKKVNKELIKGFSSVLDSAEFFCFYLLQIKGIKNLFTLLATTIVIKIYRTHKINQIKNTPKVSLLI